MTTTHEHSWSVNLEQPRYADSPALVVDDTLDAIAQTASGHYVNLVTHGDLGHPADFLYDELDTADHDIEWEYVDQCGCGGHVTRVHVR
jgi:putative CGCGG family rSAM target protein